jgi:uncharacterized protein YbjT (DUF2867 family)
LRSALKAARPARVACLSTIGAQATQPNLLNQLGIMEQILGELPMPIAFLRAAWFMENSAWDVAPARDEGVIPSFLQPLDRPVPMVATADIGRVGAELLQQTWSGQRVVELEGPRRVAPNDIAAAFSKILGRPVRAEAVPRATWADLFKSQGVKNPIPRIEMLDGFNEGWIEFDGLTDEPRRKWEARQRPLSGQNPPGHRRSRTEGGGQDAKSRDCLAKGGKPVNWGQGKLEPASLLQRCLHMAKLLQHQIIERALEIISDEGKWTRGAMARNAFGHSCSAWDKEAVRFCAVGAIYHAAFDILGESLDNIIIEITETCVLAANGLEHSSIPSVNDHEGRDAVQAMFRKALAA